MSCQHVWRSADANCSTQCIKCDVWIRTEHPIPKPFCRHKWIDVKHIYGPLYRVKSCTKCGKERCSHIGD